MIDRLVAWFDRLFYGPPEPPTIGISDLVLDVELDFIDLEIEELDD